MIKEKKKMLMRQIDSDDRSACRGKFSWSVDRSSRDSAQLRMYIEKIFSIEISNQIHCYHHFLPTPK